MEQPAFVAVHREDSGATKPIFSDFLNAPRRPEGRRQGRSPGPTKGVTLVEMLVVVTIIGLMAGISYPSISAGLDSVRLRSATDSVAGFLNAAVVHAERRQEPVELVVSTQANALEAYSDEPGFTRELKMPDGVAIENVLPQVEEQDGPRRLMLLPNATVPGVGIQLVNRHGSRRVVRLDPMTGFPRVESVEKQ